MKYIKPFLFCILPVLLHAFGNSLNQLVIAVNGHQMPVLWPPAYGEWHPDPAHAVMTPGTHLKFLGDWLVRGEGIYSIGGWLEEISTNTSVMVGSALAGIVYAIKAFKER